MGVFSLMMNVGETAIHSEYEALFRSIMHIISC